MKSYILLYRDELRLIQESMVLNQSKHKAMTPGGYTKDTSC